MRILTPLILLLAVVGVAILSDRPQPRADFAFANGSDINTLDPQRMSWMPDLRVGRLLFEGLVKHDVLSRDFDVVPAVAESWEVSEDGLTYTFHLRPDAKWSNGRPVTADDFRYSWRRAMLPDLASDYFAMFMFVEGAQAFYEARTADLEAYLERPADERTQETADEVWAQSLARFDATVGMRALDERTLEITLAKRVPYFLDLCAFTVLAPVYPPLVEQYEKPDDATGRLIRRSGWTKPGVLVTNGAFMLESWRFKREVRLAKNPHYWGIDSIAIDTISIPSIPDPNSEVLAYQTGAVDWVSDVTAGYRGDMIADKLAFRAEHADEVAELRARGLDEFEIDRRLPADPRKETHAPSAFGTYFWNFNCEERLADGRSNPFHDPRVRRAFAMVIDKRSIVDSVRRLGEQPAGVLIPPGSIGGYPNPEGLPNIGDAATPAEAEAIVARARALLAEAGYPDPPNDFPITVELLFNKDAGHDLIAQTIAKNWQQHLGVPISLAQKELKVYRDDLKKKRFITTRAGWYGDYGDPTTFLDLSRTGDGNNDRGYTNAVYDGLLDKAADEPDAGTRLVILAEAERMLMQDVPMVPIFHYAHVMMFDPARITGISAHPRMKQYASLVDVLGDGKGPDKPRTMHGGNTPDDAGATGERAEATTP